MAIITYDEYLEHFGTKGMKWGVRKDSSGLKGRARSAASEKLNNRITANKALASGKGKFRDYQSEGFHRGIGALSKKASAKTATKLEARKKRLETGKATTIDIVRTYGNLGLVDLAISVKDSRN